MGKHSIRFKITVLFAGIICILIVMLLLFNITFSEKFYMQDKQEAMLNAYESIDDACNQYSSGSISDTDLRNNLEQVSTSKGMSIIIVNSDWTTFYVSTHGDEMMLERLKKSIFNNDIFQGMPDKSGSMQEQPDENRNGDINAGKKTLPEKIIDMSGNGASETRDILYQSDKYTVQKVYDSRLLDDYIELWGTLDNGNFILIRTPIQGIKDNVHISNTFITYIGIGTLIIGIIAAFVLSSYISRPIKQLSNIAERMSELDFDIKYDGKDKGEIGLLGKSMNNMSQKLEENISQLKTANLELQRDIDKKEKLEKMRTDFLSNVSHELKTPLTVISTNTDVILSNSSDTVESQSKWLNYIKNETIRMTKLVNSLLYIAKYDANETKILFKKINLSNIISSICLQYEPLIYENNKKLITDIDNNITIMGDEDKIKQLLNILMDNALKYSLNNGIIKISLKKNKQSNVYITVSNSSETINKEQLNKIFDRFFRIDSSRNRKTGGSGLGLNIAKSIVEIHKGSINVMNKDNITSFIITF